MAFETIEAFLKKMQKDPAIRAQVTSAATADDVARIALQHGFEFSGDELLRFDGRKVERVTVKKVATPGEYN
jgi:predicted ribosomally synthesized peptide with nif11-like leader